MSDENNNGFRVIRWPKQLKRPIPWDAIPAAREAQRLVDMAAAGHEEEIKRERRRANRVRNKEQRIWKRRYLIITVFTVIVGLAALGAVLDLRARLEAPDHVLKEKQAQRWIIMGPTEAVLPEDPEIYQPFPKQPAPSVR